MPVNLHSTQTQSTESSNCLTTTGRWHVWRRTSHMQTIRTDLTGGLSWCVETVWPVAVTGRSNGEERLIYRWVTEESAGEETKVTLCLEWMTIPGVSSALTMMVTLSVTIQTEQPSPTPPPPPPPPPLSLTEWQCLWTVPLARCPSTQSPLTHWSTSTPSTPLSLNPFILGSGSGLTGLVPQCLCVLYRTESLLLLEQHFYCYLQMFRADVT